MGTTIAEDEKLSPSGVTLREFGGSAVAISYPAEDALYDKAATPVPVGGEVSGLLLFRFPELTQDALTRGTMVKFGFQDAFGQAYSFNFTLRAAKDVPRYAPGLHEKVSNH